MAKRTAPFEQKIRMNLRAADFRAGARKSASGNVRRMFRSRSSYSDGQSVTSGRRVRKIPGNDSHVAWGARQIPCTLSGPKRRTRPATRLASVRASGGRSVYHGNDQRRLMFPPHVKTPQPHPSPDALIDLAIVAAMVVGFFSLSGYLELSEQVSHWTRGYERWQVDELPLTLLLLSAGLSWFGWRRWRELAVEMRARSLVEETNLRMLAQNRQLARQLIQAQEQERRHLARELHDELGQCCVAIKVDAAAIAQDTRERLPAAYASARAIAETAGHLHDVVRGMLQRLRPTGLDDLGLVACLQVLVDSWSQRHGIACTFAAEGALDDFDEATNIACYRTVQESLTNIARHAHAAQASVVMHRSAAGASAGDCIRLTIEDSGSGIPIESMRSGFGLLGMSERVNALGGSLSFSAGPSGGTRIDAVLPVPIEARSAA